MKLLITGMSGTGTSTVLAGLARHGWDVVDTDYGAWKIPAPDDRHLAVDGCVPNQGQFYDRFDAIILLTAPIEVMMDRVATRTTNDYGKTAAERAEIRTNTKLVEPLLRASADIVIDTSLATVDDVVDQILAMASCP